MANIQVTFKRTSGEASKDLEITPSMTILDVKELVQTEFGLPSGSKQRLIHKGRVLADESTVEHYNISSGETVLVQVTPTPGAAAAPSPPQATPVSSSPPSNTTSASSTAHFQSCVNTLVRSNPADQSKVGLETLIKVIDNIASNPSDEKFRKLKPSNAAFNRRLGGLTGGLDCVRALGFETADEGNLILHPSARAWDHLAACRVVASRQLTSSTPPASLSSMGMPPLAGIPPTGGAPMGGMPPFGGMGGMPNLGALPPDFARLASDPNFIQQALSNPLVQQMMASDPRMAQQAQMLRENPQLVQQMMSNPLVQQMMSNPQAMQQAMQMASQMNPGMGMPPMGMPPMGNLQFPPPPGSQVPNLFSQPAPTPNTNQQQQPNNNNSSGNGEESKTEEDLINEAIRRSLQDQ